MRRISELVIVALITAISVALFFKSDNKEVTVRKEIIKEVPMQRVAYAPESKIDFTVSAGLAVDQVVHVMSAGSQAVHSPFDFIFGGEAQQVPTMSSGSGVIISKDGYIVTNNHVIANATEIEIILNNKKTYIAKVIGKDARIDLALLKIEAKDSEEFSAMPYGDSDKIKIGEWVLAIGNPFNLYSTVTAGIVSAKARSLGMSSRTSLEAFIQTDAAVNPGNSGGALVNTKGELIGINTAIASRTGSYVGYSFAIPVNIVRKVISDFIEFGEIQRALIGVTIYEINAKSALELGIDNVEGVYINDISENGAADDSGLKIGDIITQIDGQKIKNSSELYERVGIHRPGDKIIVTVFRNEKSKDIEVVLKNQNNKTTMQRVENIDLLGAKFKVANKEVLKLAKVSYGVQVTEVNPGKLRTKGVKVGFVVLKINQEKVETVADIQRIIKNSEGGVLIEGVYPDGKRAYYAFGMDN